MMHAVRGQKAFDWSLVILVNFMWATQVPVIRLIGDRLGPVTVAFVPMIVSALIFLPLLWRENKKRNVKMRWRWKDIKYFVLPGLIGIFIMQYAYTVGSRLTLAANAGIITLTIPVIVAMFASWMLKEKMNIIRILSFILAIAGVLLTSLSDVSEADFAHSGFLAGNLIFLFACFCCGYYNTCCKLLVNKSFTELEILVYSSLIGSVASLPLLIWVEPFHFDQFVNSGKLALMGMLELSVIVYGVSSLLFFYILKRMDVTQAILGNYLLPFFIALMGVLLLSEKITPVMAIGGALILVSTLMVTVYEPFLLSLFKQKNVREPGQAAE
ncbi:MAG: DMT family transporter [Chitinophagaceae bacterium]|nr:DMT family transporter [Chitinophagaceae bacterium]